MRQHTRTIKNKLHAALSILLLAGLIAGSAYAQLSQVSISVSPTVFELSANPGDTLKESFRIVNGTDQAITLKAKAENFTAEGEEGGVNLTEDDTSYSLASWITVSPTDVTVPARGSQFFDFTINVPANAEPGGHFGAVIVSTKAVDVQNTGASVSQEAGPLILLSVSGDIVEQARIVDFKAAKSFWESGPVVLETRVENGGNVHFRPSGTIIIKNMFDKQETALDLEERNVLPGSIRKLTNEWSPGFKVGRYTATLSIVYGPDSQIDTASTSFIIFPYKIILPTLLGAILLLFALVKYRRRFAAAIRVLRGK